MEVFGYLLAIFMGFVLGLLGGGGSILSVPIFMYFFSFSALQATTYSLLVVGATSGLGAISSYRQDLIRVRDGLLFGVTSTFFVFLSRRFILPSIPEDLGLISKNQLIIIFFAIFLIISALKMISKKEVKKKLLEKNIFKITSQGAFIGAITGFIGAGGGFLIVPALHLLLGFKMKEAIGTSFMIIFINCLVGFLSSFHYVEPVSRNFLILFFILACIGLFLGRFFSTKVSNKKLKIYFGYFVLVMGLIMIFKEAYQVS